jgi:peptidoglycan/LPS O-acetylase OafA/YrhL
MFFLNAASRIFAQSPVAAFLIASIALFLFAACVHKFVERPIQSFYRARFSEADTVSTPN